MPSRTMRAGHLLRLIAATGLVAGTLIVGVSPVGAAAPPLTIVAAPVGLYIAPVPLKTAGIVFTRILKSRSKDQWSIYSISSSIHFSNDNSFLP